MKNETFYIGIKEDTKIRKELLTSSKNLIKILQEINQSNNIKEEKIQKLKELKTARDEIKILNKKIRSKMPAIEEDQNKQSLSRHSRTSSASETNTSKPRLTKKYTVDQLEKEIQEIERKLERLQ